MSEKYLVCICIPHYNNEVTISQTLDSLLSQSYKNIKIKIFDNASTDKSIEILQEYATKYTNIELFINEKNIGGEANFTKCIENLEGKYGAVFHADDLYAEDMVQKQVVFLEQHVECSAVATHGYVIDENSHIVGERPFPEKFKESKYTIVGDQKELLQSLLQYSNYITCPSVMARTDIYKNKIRFWNGKDFKTSADLDVWLRLAGFGSFGIISKPLIKYRQSSSSYSYKDMRTRTTENNIFLVLEHYIKKNNTSLTKRDYGRYQFLVLKDNVNRTINEIIKGEKASLKLTLFDKNILNVAFESKENLKIYIIALIAKFLCNFSLSQNMREKIFVIRFKK